MTATIDTRVGLRGVMAIALLAAALILPAHASASNACSHAGSDPTAAQYCSPSHVETMHTSECSNSGSGANGGSGSSGSESQSCSSSEVEVSSASGGESTSSSGSLPFTGFDAVALLAAALALAAAGFALRRLSSAEH